MLQTLGRALDRLEGAQRLDGVVGVLRRSVRRVAPPGPVADTLHGVWLGHPVHPMLTDVPIGAWTAAAVLDLLPGQRRAATTLVGLGLAAALPTALTGASDWSEAGREQQRVGLWHGLANAAATALYAASLVARLRGRRARGVALGAAGLAAVSVGGFLGGHLSYRSGAGASQALAGWRSLPEGWQDLGPLHELPESTPVRRRAGEVPLVVVRQGEAVHVLVEQCAHLAGPLADGTVEGAGADACVVCPWHGSTFRLADGAVRHGPATTPQPVLAAEVVDGRIRARRPL